MAAIPEKIGRYDVIELVGRGGMGVLYRAHDPALERDVALKMMHIDFTLDETARQRFLREAKAVARLQHPNIVTIHELGEFEATPYIVMEFLDGRDLDQVLKDEAHKPISLARKIEIVAQLCEGLAYAHEQGIVHRDIKPGNVRVLDDGSVKILDFGIAKFTMSSLTQSGTVMGTPFYMAPEQIMGQVVDGRADLFSAGVLLYELLSGTRPFSGDTPTSVAYQIMHAQPASLVEVIEDLPDALNEIVARALQKNPDERYGKAREMASDLQTVRLMLDLPLHAGTVTPGRGVSPPEAVTTELFATTIGRPSNEDTVPNVSNMPMRASAVEAAADSAPSARAETARSVSPLLLIVGAFVVVAAFAGYWSFRGDGTGAAGGTPVPSEQGAASGDGSATAGGTAPGPAMPTSFDLSSAPAGATIAVNGVDTGLVTPASVTLDGSDSVEIQLTLDGYDPVSETITGEALEAGSKDYRLRPVVHAVQVTASGAYPFEIVRGSEVLSPAGTQHDVSIAPGSAPRLRSTDHLLDQAIAVDFRGSRTQNFSAPGLGTLAVFASIETCSVVVDGQDIGFPPIPGKQVAAGGHSVTLNCETNPETQKVTVTDGARAQVNFQGGGRP